MAIREKADVVILGGGMVGLSVANQLIDRNIARKIKIIDKESELGKHASGRNSGVLHAGIYYKPGTTKAKVCVEGAKRLRKWINDRELPINNCGKIVVPTKEDQDGQLDELLIRGRENGAHVEVWNEKILKQKYPYVRSATGRCLWSPNTAVVKPKEVIRALSKELENRGVKFYKNQNRYKIDVINKSIKMEKDESISYEHLFNCTGLHADRIAHTFEVGLEYSLLPFKGLYWEITSESRIQPTTNIYPVPDLNVPFLGVHFTPSADTISKVTIGPTATPALGRENYSNIDGIEVEIIARQVKILTSQYISNAGNMRRYAHEQALLCFRPLLINSAQKLIPEIDERNITLCDKVAIRSQLFNSQTSKLEDDFLCINGKNSTHVLNAISPAFTASFALGDLIIDQALPALNLG